LKTYAVLTKGLLVAKNVNSQAAKFNVETHTISQILASPHMQQDLNSNLQIREANEVLRIMESYDKQDQPKKND
jgi:hypothetical protein